MKIAKRTAAAVTALVVTGAAAAPVLTDFASYISYQVSAEDAAPAYSLTVDKALINADSLKTLKSYKDDGLLDAGIVNKDVEAGKYDKVEFDIQFDKNLSTIDSLIKDFLFTTNIYCASKEELLTLKQQAAKKEAEQNAAKEALKKSAR